MEAIEKYQFNERCLFPKDTIVYKTHKGHHHFLYASDEELFTVESLLWACILDNTGSPHHKKILMIDGPYANKLGWIKCKV